MSRTIACCMLGLLMLACQDTEYVYRYGSPIQFQATTMKAETRGGDAITSLNGNSYGVIGYLYESAKLWENVYSQSKPNANWQNVTVSCDNDGNCTYQPLQHWDYTQRYAFFAYHPCVDGSNGVEMIDNYTNLEGVPKIVYSIPDAAFTGDASLMQDVMVAHKTDCSMLSTTQVEFYFRHVLFGLKMVIQNHQDAAISIKNFVLTLDNVQYQTATIPLDGSDITPSGSTKSLTHTYVGNEALSVPSTNNSAPYSLTNATNHILLIPQTGLKGSIKLDVLNSNGTYETKTILLDFSTKTFEEARLYVLSVQFLSDQVVVNVLNQTTWEDDSSIIEFE